MNYLKNGYLNWYKFSGRSSRAEFWSTYFFVFLLIYTYIFTSLVTGFEGLLPILFSLATIYSMIVSIGLGIRRMHDAGANGFFFIIPIVNLIYAISKSEQKENKWGPIPKESIEKKSKNNINKEPPDLIEKNNLSYAEVEDKEIIELEKRVTELENLIKNKKDDEVQQDKRKKELTDEIAKLKRELNEQ